MQKLVLDTNALLRSLPKTSRHHDLWKSLFDGRNQLCVSNEILTEYEEILTQRIPPILAQEIINQILRNPFTVLITKYYHFNLITSDPDDNKFVDCAVCAEAKFIVTEDRHFQILKEIDFPKVDIITLDEIIALI